MAEFAVNTTQLKNCSAQISALQRELGGVASRLGALQLNSVLRVRASAALVNRITDCRWAVEHQSGDLSSLARSLDNIAKLYDICEKNLKDPKTGSKSQPGGSSSAHDGDGPEWVIPTVVPVPFDPVNPDGRNKFDWSDLFKDLIIGKPYLIPSVLSFVSPATALMYITGGFYNGNLPSFFDTSRTPSSGASAEWLGYELSDGNPGITAWLGRASAEAENEWGYAGVDAYLGKAEASAKLGFSFLKKTDRKMYQDEKWKESSRLDFINVEASAGASVSALEADAKAGLGSDMLGIDGKLNGSVGTAKAEARGKISVSEDGINANLRGEAMVSAAQGEVKGTVNILGVEITGKLGGYAGAAGVKGKVGIEDNKFVLEGGAAALLGVSTGVEIGFNEEGWDNFVDYVVFWD